MIVLFFQSKCQFVFITSHVHCSRRLVRDAPLLQLEERRGNDDDDFGPRNHVNPSNIIIKYFEKKKNYTLRLLLVLVNEYRPETILFTCTVYARVYGCRFDDLTDAGQRAIIMLSYRITEDPVMAYARSPAIINRRTKQKKKNVFSSRPIYDTDYFFFLIEQWHTFVDKYVNDKGLRRTGCGMITLKT